MTKMFNNEEAGRSMVEMLGVLAIVGVLSIGGISGYSKAMSKYKINKTLDQISMLVTNIRTTYGNQNSYAGLSEANLITYELVDREMHPGSSNSLVNPYNGPITVAITDNNISFTIKYDKLPREACASIASANWGDSASSGLVSMGINEAAFKHVWTGSGATGLPILFGQAASECNQAGNANYIMWKYF